MEIKNIIKQWCDTNSLSLEELATLIVEYYKLQGKDVTSEQLQAILQYASMLDPEWIISYICIKNGYYLVSVFSIPDAVGNRHLLKRYFYE